MYAGFFTFLRKLGGATGVAVAGLVLDLAGFAPGEAQPGSALVAIRVLTGLVPLVFLAIAIAVARGYPLGRARHGGILEQLAERGRTGS